MPSHLSRLLGCWPLAAAICILGLVGLLLAYFADPLWSAQDMTPRGWIEHEHARQWVDWAYPVAGSLFAGGLLWLLVYGGWQVQKRRLGG